MLLSYGYWGWQLWSQFPGNPVFPFANEWFASTWWEKMPAIASDYGPHSLSAWLEFPLRLREPRPGYVTEVFYTDARIPLLYVLAVAAGFGALLARACRARRRFCDATAAFAGCGGVDRGRRVLERVVPAVDGAILETSATSCCSRC